MTSEGFFWDEDNQQLKSRITYEEDGDFSIESNDEYIASLSEATNLGDLSPDT